MQDEQTQQTPRYQKEILKLEKLYKSKCDQADKAKIDCNIFMYQVLSAEAAAIETEIARYCLRI